MKVLHFSTDDFSGGAAIAAYRLHTYLKQTGYDSLMIVSKKVQSADISVIQSHRSFFPLLFKKFYYKYISENKIYDEHKGLFSYPLLGDNIIDNKILQQTDIIILHWINRDFISLNTLDKILKLGKPVYWILHDMWAFTGGCHYSFDCNKYITHCGNCPHLLAPSKKDKSYQLFKAKLKLFKKYRNLQIVTPSIWLSKCAKKSRLFSNKPVHILPNILDLEIFRPINKKYAKELFFLPQDKYILLFGAIEGHANPYKGWAFLKDAIHKLSYDFPNKYEVIIMGSFSSSEIVNSIPFKVHFAGHLKDNQSIVSLYNAVDVFVAPSLADNFPNTILESMACGTPCVGFDVGGIPDLIDHKKNGYLAKYKDSIDLAFGINWVIDNTLELNKNARDKAASVIEKGMQGIKQQIDNYV